LRSVPGSSSILGKVFGNSHSGAEMLATADQGPIAWLDGNGFAAASLDLIYYRVLSHLPYYKSRPNELSSKGIMVPGELGPVSLQSPINILVCDSNDGCFEVAEELKAMFSERNSMFIYDAAEFLEYQIDHAENVDVMDRLISLSSFSDRPTFFLLYLNKLTFGDTSTNKDNNVIEVLIESCIDDPNIHLVLVHEQNALKGGCEFDDIFKATPQKLIDEPYSLYSEIAIPLYQMKEYRDVSLNLILNKMVATDKNVLQSSFMESLKRTIHKMTRRSQGISSDGDNK